MLPAKFFIATLALFATNTIALPTDLSLQEARSTQSVTITLCTGAAPSGGCVAIPVVSDICMNLTGGLSFLQGAVSGVIIPAGFICTLFLAFGCVSGGGASQIGLLGGTYNLAVQAPGPTGPIGNAFNDVTNSFTCSPL